MLTKILESLEKDSVSIQDYEKNKKDQNNNFFLDKGFLTNSIKNRMTNNSFSLLFKLFNDKYVSNNKNGIKNVNTRKNMNLFIHDDLCLNFDLASIDICEDVEVNGIIKKRYIRLNIWIKQNTDVKGESNAMRMSEENQIKLKDLQEKIRNRNRVTQPKLYECDNNLNNDKPKEEEKKKTFSELVEEANRLEENMETEMIKDAENKKEKNDNDLVSICATLSNSNCDSDDEEFIDIPDELIKVLTKIQSRYKVFFSDLRIDAFSKSTVWILINCPSSILNSLATIIRCFDKNIPDEVNRNYSFIIAKDYISIRQTIFKGSKDAYKVNELGRILNRVPSISVK